MATGTEILRRVRRLIIDESTPTVSGKRWSDAELLKYVTEAQRAIVSLKPEAYVFTRVFEPTAGQSRQLLTASALLPDGTTSPSPYRLIRVEANGSAPPAAFVFLAGGPSGGYYGYTNGVIGSVVSNSTPYTFTYFRSNAGYDDLFIASADLYAAVSADPGAFQFTITGPGVDVTFLGDTLNLVVPGELSRLTTAAFQSGEEYTCTINSV
jgi:hypothetical protein